MIFLPNYNYNFALGPIPDQIPEGEKINGISDENLDIYWEARKKFKMSLNKFFFFKNIATNWTIKVSEQGLYYQSPLDFCDQRENRKPKGYTLESVFYQNGLKPSEYDPDDAKEDTIINAIYINDLILKFSGTSKLDIKTSPIDPGPESSIISNRSEQEIVCPDSPYPVTYYSYTLNFIRTFGVRFGLSAYLDPETLEVWPSLSFAGDYNYVTWEGLGNLSSRKIGGVDFNGSAKCFFAGIGIPVDFVASNELGGKDGSINLNISFNFESKRSLR